MSKKWVPQEGPQTRFLVSTAFEVLYGGAKGGGKSDALLFGATRFVNHANYRALIVRRTYPKLEELIDRSNKFFPFMGARYSRQEKTWTFPSGAKIKFGHCEHDGDEFNYQGHQYHYIGFDQLEEFTFNMYSIIKGCARGADSIPKLVRASANPGGIGNYWVYNYFIKDKEFGKIYYTEEVINGKTVRIGRQFIFASVYDNKILLEKDPQYLLVLKQMPEKYQRMYIDGDWSYHEEPDQIVSKESIMLAKKVKGLLKYHAHDNVKMLGVDVARYGSDSTVISSWTNNILKKLDEYKNKSISEVSRIVHKKIEFEGYKPEWIAIDTDGLGAGVYDNLEEDGYICNAIVGGAKQIEVPSIYTFANFRSQIYWTIGESLKGQEIQWSIDDEDSENELIAIRYSIDNDRYLKVERKDEIKKRIGKSPDKSDAIVYGWANKLINGGFYDSSIYYESVIKRESSDIFEGF